MDFSDDRLCKSCRTVDLNGAFAPMPLRTNGPNVRRLVYPFSVSDTDILGNGNADCPLCRILHEMIRTDVGLPLVTETLPRNPARPPDQLDKLRLDGKLTYVLCAMPCGDVYIPQDPEILASGDNEQTVSAIARNRSAPPVLLLWRVNEYLDEPLKNLLRAKATGRIIALEPSNTSNCESHLFGRTRNPARIDLNYVKAWVSQCEAEHDGCARATVRPVVEHMKFIDCHAKCLVPAAPDMDYVALSYVWGQGESPELAAYPKLPERLPAVIADSIEVVNALGMRYLWVDRYCIWQDDPAHKMSQISQMDRIYNGAYLTIMAAAGVDPTYGLPGVNLRPRSVRQPTVAIGKERLVGLLSRPYSTVVKTKWDTRAWTFQEGYLSRRRLIFTDEQVSFECKFSFAMETTSKMMHESVFPSAANQTKHLRSPSGIKTLINLYTQRAISWDGDGLNGLLGIFNYWMTINKGCFHYWGLPVYIEPTDSAQTRIEKSKDCILGGLSWHFGSSATPRRRKGLPSWSWVGFDGSIYAPDTGVVLSPSNGTHLFMPEKKPSKEVTIQAERLDGSAVDWGRILDSEMRNEPSKTWSQFLLLTCPAFRPEQVVPDKLRPGFYNCDLTKTSSLDSTDDYPLLCLILWESDSGLLVKKVDNHFERIGLLVHDLDKNNTENLELKRKIKIIDIKLG